MKCVFCGSEVQKGAKTCSVCGVAVEEEQSHDDLFDSRPAPASSPRPRPDPAPAPTPVKPEKDPGKGLGLAGMILGIASVALGIFGCCCSMNVFFCLTVSVVGLILSILAANKSKKAGFKNVFATVGIIISAIATAIWGLLSIFAVLYLIVYVGLYGLSGLGLLEEILYWFT